MLLITRTVSNEVGPVYYVIDLGSSEGSKTIRRILIGLLQAEVTIANFLKPMRSLRDRLGQ